MYIYLDFISLRPVFLSVQYDCKAALSVIRHNTYLDLLQIQVGSYPKRLYILWGKIFYPHALPYTRRRRIPYPSVLYLLFSPAYRQGVAWVCDAYYDLIFLLQILRDIHLKSRISADMSSRLASVEIYPTLIVHRTEMQQRDFIPFLTLEGFAVYQNFVGSRRPSYAGQHTFRRKRHSYLPVKFDVLQTHAVQISFDK